MRIKPSRINGKGVLVANAAVRYYRLLVRGEFAERYEIIRKSGGVIPYKVRGRVVFACRYGYGAGHFLNRKRRGSVAVIRKNEIDLASVSGRKDFPVHARRGFDSYAHRVSVENGQNGRNVSLVGINESFGVEHLAGIKRVRLQHRRIVFRRIRCEICRVARNVGGHIVNVHCGSGTQRYAVFAVDNGRRGVSPNTVGVVGIRMRKSSLAVEIRGKEAVGGVDLFEFRDRRVITSRARAVPVCGFSRDRRFGLHQFPVVILRNVVSNGYSRFHCGKRKIKIAREDEADGQN